MSNSRPGGKSVRFNEGAQQSNSSRHQRREDERDSGLAEDRHYQSHNLDALREAYATLLAENQTLRATISKQDVSLSTSHRTIKELEGYAKGLATERGVLEAENNDQKEEIARLQSENQGLQRDNMEWKIEVGKLHEQLFRPSTGSDKMSGASGPSGASGTSGSSSNNVIRRSSKRESQETERLKGRFNRSSQNDAPVASAIPPTSQRIRRPSISTTRPYIEEPDARNYNLVTRSGPGHDSSRVPRSNHEPTGDYFPHPLPSRRQ